jgi:hypothetical protein
MPTTFFLTLLSAFVFVSSPAAGQPATADAFSPAAVDRFARLALACVHQEYPNKIAHVLNGDEDALPPRRLSPAFYGCYDWHSSVHGHWLLARLVRLYPDAPFAADARKALGRSLTGENIAGEVRYLRGKGRISFERPYGLAWLLQLGAELREWKTDQAATWAATLAPLEQEAVARLSDWLPKLTQPIRIGEHSQTAFSWGSCSIGRAARATSASKRCCSRARATSTRAIATARWPTNRRARTSSRRASPRRT